MIAEPRLHRQLAEHLSFVWITRLSQPSKNSLADRGSA